MSQLKSVVVFCGGSAGRRAVYTEEAYKLGTILAKNNIKLIYGAGGTGVMRAVADGALDNDGYVIGATIQSLYAMERPDLVMSKIRKTEVWHTLADRKVSMTKQADAICILPGGFGTMDELFEMLTLRQLGISTQPIILVNIAGFFDMLYKLLLEMVGEGFVRPHQIDLFRIVKTVDEVLPAIYDELAQQEKHRQESNQQTQEEPPKHA